MVKLLLLVGTFVPQGWSFLSCSGAQSYEIAPAKIDTTTMRLIGEERCRTEGSQRTGRKQERGTAGEGDEDSSSRTERQHRTRLERGRTGRLTESENVGRTPTTWPKDGTTPKYSGRHSRYTASGRATIDPFPLNRQRQTKATTHPYTHHYYVPRSAASAPSPWPPGAPTASQ